MEKAITNGKLVYLAGKYSSSVGPAFALVLNAINGNVIRDEQEMQSHSAKTIRLQLTRLHLMSFMFDNGDNPIYNKKH